MKKVIARVGRGTSTHIGKKDAKGNVAVSCGSSTHGNGSRGSDTFIPYKLENVTCKKCLARAAEEQQQPEQEKLVVGMSFSVSKEDMKANKGRTVFNNHW